jgi:hypothetical protein
MKTSCIMFMTYKTFTGHDMSSTAGILSETGITLHGLLDSPPGFYGGVRVAHLLNLIQPTISLEMPVPSQGHYCFHSFPVVD